jgi:hypothetical protein
MHGFDIQGFVIQALAVPIVLEPYRQPDVRGHGMLQDHWPTESGSLNRNTNTIVNSFFISSSIQLIFY